MIVRQSDDRTRQVHASLAARKNAYLLLIVLSPFIGVPDYC